MPVSSPYPFIGGSVLGGTSGSILFINSSGQLAQLPTNFFVNPSTGATTITPTTGTALTLYPAAAGTRVLTTSHTDTAYPGSGNGVTELDRGLWSLNSVLSNSGGVGENFVGFSLAPNLSDFVCSSGGTFAMGLSEIFKFGLHSTDDGSAVAFGLRFFIQSQGTSGSTFNTLIGANGGVDHRSDDAVTGATGVQGNIITAAGSALITTANAFNCATNIGGTGVTSLRGLRVNNPSGASAITTFHGVSIAAITRGTTIVGVSSGITAASGRYGLDFASAQSRHVGNFFFGAATDPTAKVHIAAGTAAADTAPLKFTSGTSLTVAVAGTVEFTTDDLFFTITTGAARKAFVLDDGARLTSGKIPVATTNGRLIDLTASSAYTPTNVTTDRAYDANATTLDELADVVGTMIADLQAKGILG